ncbi:MAG: heparinase II/III family protein [Opitutaceae bacterium]
MGFGDHNLNLPDGQNFAPAADKVQAMARLLADRPYHLGVPARQRDAWARWKEHAVGRHYLATARAETTKPLVRITNELIAKCYRGDRRAGYTEAATAVRERLIAMTFADCVDPTGEYLELIESEINAFTDLVTWVAPCHDDSGGNFAGTTIEIDLGSGQWAALFADIDFLLGDRLSSATRQTIRSEIEKRIFAPFRQRIESGQDIYWWVTCTHNWNTVCLNCVLTCALWLKEDLQERAWYLALVDDLIAYSNQGFEESGFYTEGLSYWTYGFGNYVALSELVRGATGGRIDWLKQPKPSRMARYGVRMELQDGLYPTFADSRMEFEPIHWLNHWLNNRQDDDPARIRSTAETFDPFVPLGKQSVAAILLNLFHTFDPANPCKLPRERALREWFEDVQFLICRPAADAPVRLAATFQGGHNGVNHNHNDLGTFTVAIGNHYLICDPGLETYTDRTFSPQRYQSDLLNSYGHPVPVVADTLQMPGKDEHRAGYGSHAFARVLATSFSDETDRVVLDLTRAYPAESLRHLHRTFVYARAASGRVEVEDAVEFTTPQFFETAVITYADWSQQADGAVVIKAGDAAIKVTARSDAGDLAFSHCLIQEVFQPTRLAWRLTRPTRQARVQLEVQPL